jgi:hypothetical protein
MAFDGQHWATTGHAGFSAGEADYISLALSADGTPCVAYQDVRHGGKAAVERLSTLAPQVTRIGPGRRLPRTDAKANVTAIFNTPMDESTLINSTNFRVRDDNGLVTAKGIDYDRSAFSATFHPARTLKGDVSVTLTDNIKNSAGHAFGGMRWRFRVPFWQSLGNPDFSAAQAEYTSLAVAPDGTPYIAYQDGANGGKVTVDRYDHTAKRWIPVGNPGFSDAKANFVSIVIAPDGTPYVAYQDSNGNKAAVEEYDEATEQWVRVGGPGISPGAVGDVALAIAPGGTPYLAYPDGPNGSKATVEKYDATSKTWMDVGKADFSDSNTGGFSLVIGPDGTPYVAFKSNTIFLLDTRVEKYDAAIGQWVDVGSGDFTVG